ncbi:MAG: (d)CMP kinase [Bacteroidia bacterium]|nr:(d)CMP kinase [Bacteroidia bacterium]
MKTNNPKITIAIDGYSGCGKSTTAKGVAQKLGYLYIDSGAMYRAVTLYFLRHNIPFDKENDQMLAALCDIHITFEVNPETRLPEVILNGEKVESSIRTPEVAANVSPVSVHPPVRHALVKLQQELGQGGGIVMDGRDIGTVVFPHAELKVFMSADVKIRALRRQAELADKGIIMTPDEILYNLENRDIIDSSRLEGPLKKAMDARVIDTSKITVAEQIEQVLIWANEVIHEKSSCL